MPKAFPFSGRPLRFALVGLGGMGLVWLDALSRSWDAEVAALVDVDLELLKTVSAEHGLDVPLCADVAEALARTDLDAIVNVTVPEAHLPVALQAMDLGLHVLGEKPMTATLPEAVTLVEAAERSGLLVMVSQSRRYNQHLRVMRHRRQALGRIGLLTTEFFRAPRFGGFRDRMPHPLLRDMAIHPFDTARYLLDEDPVSVTCQEADPSWSWYDGNAVAAAQFEMSGGTTYFYTGGWCNPGLETSWNGAWRMSGEHWRAVWDGGTAPVAEVRSEPEAWQGRAVPDGVHGALADFVRALRTGDRPMGEVRDNLMSLVMVEAAVEAARTDTRVRVDALLERARAAAHLDLKQEESP